MYDNEHTPLPPPPLRPCMARVHPPTQHFPSPESHFFAINRNSLPGCTQGRVPGRKEPRTAEASPWLPRRERLPCPIAFYVRPTKMIQQGTKTRRNAERTSVCRVNIDVGTSARIRPCMPDEQSTPKYDRLSVGAVWCGVV